MNRPQQRDFIPISNTPPPPPINLRGDLPPADEGYLPPESLTPAERRLVDHMETAQARLLADLAAGANDDTDALRAELDYPRGPVSPTTLAAAWRAGQRHVDAMTRNMARWSERHPGEPFTERRKNGLRHPDPMPEPTDAAIKAAMADDQRRDMDRFGDIITHGTYRRDPYVIAQIEPDTEDARIRAEIEAGTYRAPEPPTVPARFVDSKRGTFPLTETPAVTPRATESAPAPPTRYVEGLPHTDDCYRPPQGVPDAYGPRLVVRRAQEVSDPTDAVEAAERDAGVDWRLFRIAAFILTAAFALTGWGVWDWLHRMGRI